MIKEIKPNTITHLCCLITGDRFYCWSDTKKEVWQLKLHTMRKFNGAMKKYSVCYNDKGDKKWFDANRVIMFLRRTAVPKPKRFYDIIDNFFA